MAKKKSAANGTYILQYLNIGQTAAGKRSKNASRRAAPFNLLENCCTVPAQTLTPRSFTGLRLSPLPGHFNRYLRLTDSSPLKVPAAARPPTVPATATPPTIAPMVVPERPAPEPVPAPAPPTTPVTDFMVMTRTTCDAPAAGFAPGMDEPVISTFLPAYLDTSVPSSWMVTLLVSSVRKYAPPRDSMTPVILTAAAA